MQRSITRRLGSGSAAPFSTVVPSSSAPRLGLDRHVRFRTVDDRPTLLRRPELGPVALLRADWRAVVPARPRRSPADLAGPLPSVRWANLGGRAGGRRSRAATAPWRG